MSVQFGKVHFDGRPVDPQDLEEVRPVLAPYGPDSEGFICKKNIGILYRAFHTTKESLREEQPHNLPSGAILTWDGRLDNRNELLDLLHLNTNVSPTDLDIVAALYERWGTASFAKIIGDWALSVWHPEDESLVLARDFVGIRQLYYAVHRYQAMWCTVLDPLVLLARQSFTIEEEYIAGWLSFFPASHLTPYAGVHAVPPSCYVRLNTGGHTTHRYWDFEPSKRIVHRNDTDYEEHFRSVFAMAVKRRLRSDSAVLAELSGGMDSSSIVCMADQIMSKGSSETANLYTVSYFNDREPNWNERPYVLTVEKKRVSSGCHIDISEDALDPAWRQLDSFSATPAGTTPFDSATTKFAEYARSIGSRVLLSGIGGDEVSGGIPAAEPELADLLATLRVRQLAHRLKLWAIEKRQPWVHVLWSTVRGFLPVSVGKVPKYRIPVPWLQVRFAQRHWNTLIGYESRIKPFGPLPSFQENLSTLEALRRQIGCAALPSEPPYDKRYPYLDRDLLEFLYAIPRTQIVQPGRRRSLMRRALRGIVPSEILERRRKAYVTRAPRELIASHFEDLRSMTAHMLSGSFEIVDPRLFLEMLTRASEGREVHFVGILRTISLEVWLKAMVVRGIVEQAADPARSTGFDFTAKSRARELTKKGGNNHALCEA